MAGVLAGWVPFSFHRGKKLVTLGLLSLSAVWLQDGSIAIPSQPPLQWEDSLSMSSHEHWLLDRPP